MHATMATTGRVQSLVEDFKLKGDHFQSILQHYSTELIAISSATEAIEKHLENKISEICHLQDTLRGKNQDLAALKRRQKITETEKSDLRMQFVEEQRDLKAQLSVAQIENEDLKSELSAALAVINDRDRTLGELLQGDGQQTSQSFVVLPSTIQSSDSLPECIVLNEQAGQRLLVVKTELKSSPGRRLTTLEDVIECSSHVFEKIVLTDSNNNSFNNDVTNTSIGAPPSSMTGSSIVSGEIPLNNQPETQTAPVMPVLTSLPESLSVSANDETTHSPTLSLSISDGLETAVPCQHSENTCNLRNVFNTLISELSVSTSEDFGFDPESGPDIHCRVPSTQPRTNESRKSTNFKLKSCSVVLERCVIDTCGEERVDLDDEHVISDPIDTPSIDQWDVGTEDFVTFDPTDTPEPDDSDYSDQSWLPPLTINPISSHGCEPTRKKLQGASSTYPSKRLTVRKRVPSAAAGSAAQAQNQKALQDDRSEEVKRIGMKEVTTTQADTTHPVEFGDNNQIQEEDGCSKVMDDDDTMTSLPTERRKSYNCRTCGKKYVRGDHFISHMRTHTGWHENTFTQQRVQTHTPEKSYKCTNCTKAFSTKCNLMQHIRIHTGEAFKCQHCKKVFSRKCNLVAHVKIHTGEKLHKCPKCMKAFTFKSNLIAHLRIHTGEKPYKCQHCSKAFAQKGAMIQHVKIHTGDKPFKCNRCPIAFAHNGDLKKHARIHTGEKPHKCPHCVKAFAWKNGLVHHIRIHTGEKPFKCQHCSKAFAQKVNLIRHVRIHIREKPYKCPHCIEAFSLKSSLVQHIRIHTGEKLYKCPHCVKAFSLKSNLVPHIRIHTGEKPYKCPHCVKAFSLKSNLVHHIRIHTGEKPYKCPHCMKAFSMKAILVQHIRIHTGEKPYKCPHCIKAFAWNNNLVHHIRIHTGEKPYKCPHCIKAFSLNYNLGNHIRSHRRGKLFKCSHCMMAFALKRSLVEHFKSHTGEKLFKCNLCKKSFHKAQYLKAHNRIHTGEKPFKCQFCPRAFPLKCNLMRHVIIHTGEKPYVHQ